MIENKLYYPLTGSSMINGASFITDPALAFVSVLQVSRSGIIKKKIPGPPSSNDEFHYISGDGEVLFDPSIPFITGEYVEILIKH